MLQVDTDNAYPGIMDEIEQSMRRLKPGGSVHRTARKGCKAIKMQWKHWPCVFPQHGPGRKHNRKIVLEDWQQEIVDRHSGLLLRGLFHSDGSRFINRVHAVTLAGRQEYEYVRYYFGNKSRDILEICGAALDSLGISWRFTRPDNLAVSRKDAVAALDKIVGPKY